MIGKIGETALAKTSESFFSQIGQVLLSRWRMRPEVLEKEYRQKLIAAWQLENLVENKDLLLAEVERVTGSPLFLDELQFRKFGNLATIIDLASETAPNLRASSAPALGWTEAFVEGASSCEDEEVRELWANALATETISPHSIPLFVIRLIQQLGPEQAKAIRDILRNRVDHPSTNRSYYFHSMDMEPDVYQLEAGLCLSLGVLTQPYGYRPLGAPHEPLYLSDGRTIGKKTPTNDAIAIMQSAPPGIRRGSHVSRAKEFTWTYSSDGPNGILQLTELGVAYTHLVNDLPTPDFLASLDRHFHLFPCPPPEETKGRIFVPNEKSEFGCEVVL